MTGNGNGDTWCHCRKGPEPRHVMHVALFTFSTAMLLALFHFTNVFIDIKCSNICKLKSKGAYKKCIKYF